MIETNEKIIDIWIEDGVIHAKNTQRHYTREMVDFVLKQRDEIRKGKDYPLLSYMHNMSSATKSARERLMEEDANTGITAMAVLTSNRVQNVYFNFMTTIYKMRKPVKMFSNKEKALQWLQQYKTN